MPYCPKCDMEFVEGMTTCTDCGGPLVASKEVYDAQKKEEERKQQEELAALSEAYAADLSEAAAIEVPTDRIPVPERTHVYVKKAQQYEDFKSSASAFLIVGGVLLVISILCWFNLVKLPMAGTSRYIFQSVLTVLGIVSIVLSASSTKSARQVSSQVAEEEIATNSLIDWFCENHSAAGIDETIASQFGDLPEEEKSLKRFDIIQDILVTNHDIADQSYIDSISEEIYTRLYE